MRRSVCVPLTLLLLILLSCITMVCFTNAYTTVNNTISSDITWTKAGSPYNLVASIVIPSGVTLTIEPGVVVNFGNYHITVDGVLNARGTDAEKIILQKNSSSPSKYSTSQIRFTSISQGWNEQTQQGCIIENAVIDSVTFSIFSSVKLSKIETNTGLTIYDGSPVISNSNFNIFDSIKIIAGSPAFTNNVLYGHGDSIGIHGSGNVTLSGNTIAFFTTDISVYSGNWLISNNDISHCNTGIELANSANVVIQKNSLHDVNVNGISGGNALIENNTIVTSNIGINNPFADTIIRGNNIIGHFVNSITATITDVAASNNYWGTTNLTLINQTIYDRYDDPRLGIVVFTPILDAPNPEAPATFPTNFDPIGIEIPVGTPEPTPNYTPMPTVDHNIIKNNDNQDRSLLNLNALMLAAAIPLAIVWAVVLLGYRVKAKIRELRES
ncbi:MAG: right-handed parallel beta-helix repeat-containing protein [Candidatus Bathyarchaeia archaeon]